MRWHLTLAALAAVLWLCAPAVTIAQDGTGAQSGTADSPTADEPDDSTGNLGDNPGGIPDDDINSQPAVDGAPPVTVFLDPEPETPAPADTTPATSPP